MRELENYYVEVSKVAYNLFEKRGYAHGHDTADWLEAEMIVKKKYLKDHEPTAGNSPKSANPGKKANKQIAK